MGLEEQAVAGGDHDAVRDAGGDRTAHAAVDINKVQWTAGGGAITVRCASYIALYGRWTGKPPAHRLHSLRLRRWVGWWRHFHKPANRMTRRYRG